MLIYIILRKLCLVNEWNIIINMQIDMVKKKIQTLTTKKRKILLILAFKKLGHYTFYHTKYLAPTCSSEGPTTPKNIH